MKRKRCPNTRAASRKRKKGATAPAAATLPSPEHPVLQRLYPQVLTLRHHLLSRLHKSAKNRRRRIAQIGLSSPAHEDEATRDIDAQVGLLLDSTLVGSFPDAASRSVDQEAKERQRDTEAFTQQRFQGTSSGTFKPGYFMQSEVGRVMHTTVPWYCTCGIPQCGG